MRRAANFAPSKPQIVIASSDSFEIQAPIVALRTILQVSTDIRNDFIGNKLKVNEVGYPESSNIPRSDMKCTTVVRSDMKGNTIVKYGIFDIETKSLVASINCITLSFKETSDVDTLLDICCRKNRRSTTYNIVCCS